jgi:hypothetical protein
MPAPSIMQITIKPTITKPFPVAMSMHAEIRANVLKRFRAGSASLGLPQEAPVPPGSLLVVQGTQQTTRDDTDHEPVFRQESNFHYLFGVKEPGAYGVIDVDTGAATLFMERLPEEYQMWMGPHKSLEEWKVMLHTHAHTHTHTHTHMHTHTHTHTHTHAHTHTHTHTHTLTHSLTHSHTHTHTLTHTQTHTRTHTQRLNLLGVSFTSPTRMIRQLEDLMKRAVILKTFTRDNTSKLPLSPGMLARLHDLIAATGLAGIRTHKYRRQDGAWISSDPPTLSRRQGKWKSGNPTRRRAVMVIDVEAEVAAVIEEAHWTCGSSGSGKFFYVQMGDRYACPPFPDHCGRQS